MKLASLKEGGRDGCLVVVSEDLTRAARATGISANLQTALENWAAAEEPLRQLSDAVENGGAENLIDVETADLASPLPRAFQFLDGSAYLVHVERVRRARGAEMPPSFLTDPLMYQAVSDGFHPPTGTIAVESEDFGIDFEAEVCVITGDVPMGVSPAAALEYVRLLCLVNDVSLRNLIPAELGKGFGFMQSKPRSALSPVAVTPDQLGENWRDGKLHLPLTTHYNGALFGNPECGVDMQFDFGELIAHAARTRPLAAGTIIGSGTIANKDESRGSSCLAERRMLEIIADGEAKTPFMRFGDTVRVEMLDAEGATIFGAIEHMISRYDPS
ncbi:MAG: fumarylacetoacetate hydrolase family protein [Gammaproteobacteria bacterium]|nr:MAG: fumarylacetoacetate hydrolase family protein [Gammaproteobacteria bacterium]